MSRCDDPWEAMVRRQRAALTRAVRNGDPQRVVLACREAIRAWNAPGSAWPDDWSRWQRALDDAFPWFAVPILEELEEEVEREALAHGCLF